MIRTTLAIILFASAATAQEQPVTARQIYVTDGDTIRFDGAPYRLVDFDAPEIGRTAKCEAEVAANLNARPAVLDADAAVAQW